MYSMRCRSNKNRAARSRSAASRTWRNRSHTDMCTPASSIIQMATLCTPIISAVLCSMQACLSATSHSAVSAVFGAICQSVPKVGRGSMDRSSSAHVGSIGIAETGRTGLLGVWRSGLPRNNEGEKAATIRMRPGLAVPRGGRPAPAHSSLSLDFSYIP